MGYFLAPEDLFVRSTDATLNEMDAIAARAFHRTSIHEAVVSSKLKHEKEKAMNTTFGFGAMLDLVVKGVKCRRRSWEQGKYVYRAADDSTTLRTKDFTRPLEASKVYHPTPDMFATDWEVAVELFDFAEALAHVRAGGKVRRKGWQDSRTHITRLNPSSDEIWVHFPNGTRQEWRPYCYDFLKCDWIKVDVLQVPAAPTSSTQTKIGG